MASQLPQTPPQPQRTDDGNSVVLERRAQKTKPPQMYQVVMLNDDYTPMEFVVVVIQEFVEDAEQDEASPNPVHKEVTHIEVSNVSLIDY